MIEFDTLEKFKHLIFRKEKTREVYDFLRAFLLWKVSLIILLKLSPGKRFAGREFWVKRKRTLYSQHYDERISFEEVYYGVPVMVLCDEDGVVYDIWFKPGSWHEVRMCSERVKRSGWFRFLVSEHEVYGDKGYRGVEGVVVCDDKEKIRNKASGGRCDICGERV